MIRTEWPLISSNASEDVMEYLSVKLRLLKGKVKSWTKLKSIELKDKSALVEDEINSILDSSTTAIMNASEQSRLAVLRLEHKKWVDHELLSARLQSRVSWALQGDANTKFFHAVASARKNHNAIWGLEDEAGNLVIDDQELKTMGMQYFKNIFADDNLTNIASQLKVIRLFPSFIGPKERESFSCQVTLTEVEAALKSFKKDKSLGFDGWPVEFYLAFFDLLGHDLVKMVETSRKDGRVVPSLNSTFIALIRKKESPVSFADFCPISLCNLVYKLISKVVALRLKPFLEKSISPQ